MKLEEPTSEQLAQEDLSRRQNWEQGNIDYMGRDSFDNIWSKISQTINKQTEPTSTGEPAKPIAPADVQLSSELQACSLQPGVEKAAPAVADEPTASPPPVEEQPKPVSGPVVTVSEPTAPVTSEPVPVTVAATPIAPSEPVPASVTVAVTSIASPEPVPAPAAAIVPEVASAPVSVLLEELKSSPEPASTPVTATETSESGTAVESPLTAAPAESVPSEAPSKES